MNQVRGTGRTTQMLKDANEWACNNNQRALIVVHSAEMIQYCQHIVVKRRLVGIRRGDIRSITNIMRGMALHGITFDGLFIDHFVWESCQSHYYDPFWGDYDILRRMRTVD